MAEEHPRTTDHDDGIFDDAEGLFACAQRSFMAAAQEQVRENDRRGIPTHGATGGRLTVRLPSRATSLDRH